MNLKEIRDAMFAQADYSPSSSPEATSRVNNFINRAYNQLALEAPFLFFESKVGLVTEPDTKSKAGLADGSVLDQVELAPTTTLPAGARRDLWTYRTTYTVAQYLANTGLLTGWDVFRGWDGRMIDLIEDDGTIHRHQIRSVWYDYVKGAPGDSHFYFTVVKPTFAYSGTGYDSVANAPEPTTKFKFRVFTDAYPLPSSTIEVKSVRLRDGDNSRPLDVYGQQEAENLVLAGPDSQVASGIPRCIFRRQHAHLKGPSVPPGVQPVNFDVQIPVKWLGPEPYGEFEYRVTYTWGKRGLPLAEGGLGHWEAQGFPYIINEGSTYPAVPSSSALGASANRLREPRFESPPSPASVPYNTSALAKLSTDDELPAIAVSLPNISYALGFLMSVTQAGTTYTRQSLNQSGVYIRIYRRRKSTQMAGYGELTNKIGAVRFSQLDADDGFYLLAETRVDTTNNGVFIDNGTILPDYSCRLKDVHGYQTFQFYPKPDKSYQTDIRCVTRPQPLVDDSDCPVVHAEAINVLLEKAMVLFYENLGQPQQSVMSLQKYREELLTLSKRYGDLRPAAVPVLRRMTRASRVRTLRKWNHRLTTDDLGGVVE